MQELKVERNETEEKANEYRVSNKTLEKNVSDEKRTASVALQEIRWLQVAIFKAEVESKLPAKTADKLSTKTTVTAKNAGKTADTPAERMDPEHLGQVIDLRCESQLERLLRRPG